MRVLPRSESRNQRRMRVWHSSGVEYAAKPRLPKHVLERRNKPKKQKRLMKETDILIPTSTIGSYAPPSWLCVTLEAIERGELGETDINETFDDAVRIAIDDQERAGVDIITEGEMRRQDFVLGFYERLAGLQQLPAPRTQGPDGHDQRG